MKKQIAQFLFLVCDLLLILTVVILWFCSSGSSMSGGLPFELLAYGRLFGLFAWYLILKQILYIGRTKWLIYPFGFAALGNAHKKNGALIYLVIVLHVVLTGLGVAGRQEAGFGESILNLCRANDDFIAALIAAGLLTVVFVVSCLRSKIRYEVWYYLHWLVYLAVILSWEHQVEYGYDFAANEELTNIWIGLTLFSFLNFLWYRFLAPLKTFRRQRFTVERLVKENDEVHSIYIRAQHIEELKIKAGQFIIVRFLVRGFWSEGHPFSISALPTNNELRITVKELGDYTSRIGQLNPGTKVLIEGPLGEFTAECSQTNKVLLLAGGVGVTPLRAIAEVLLQQKKEVILFYSHRYERDGIFFSELAALQAKGLKIFHVISRGEINIGEQGRITRERLKRLVPGVQDYEAFVCGPKLMMRDCCRILRSLGVPRSKIYTERFLY